MQQDSLEQNINRQVSFLVSYRYSFGELVDDAVAFWPTAELLMQAKKLDLQSLNNDLHKLGSDTIAFA